MKLSDSAIVDAICSGDITIKPYVERNLGPNSYDLTLNEKLLIYTMDEPLDVKRPNKTTEIIIPDEGYVIRPGTLYLGCTNEVAGAKRKYVPCIEGRSSIARLGLKVHICAGFGDVGFVAQWTLELEATHPIRIYKNMRICQIYFDVVQGEVQKPYNGKYQDSTGVVASKSYADFS